MAKVTSSSNRSKRTSTKPVTKGQNPQRANRQSVSQAKVSSAANRAVTGSAKVTTGKGASSMKADAQRFQQLNQSASARAGKAAEAKPRTPAPGTGNVVRTAIERGRAAAAQKGARAATQAMSRTLAAARTARNVAGAAKMAGPVGAAAAVMAPRPLADGSMAGRNYGKFQNARSEAFKKAKAIKGSPVVGPRKSAAGQFDSAFAAARKAGKKEFTWRGKRYNTKVK